MHPEEAKKIKCDRCGVAYSLYRYGTGWRCSLCIWNERENLIEWAKILLNSTDYTHHDNHTKRVVVFRKDMDALAKVIQDVTA